MIRRRIERVVDFEPGEFGPAVLSTLYFFCLLFGYFMLRPVRDALGLEGGVDNLPVLFLVTLGVMVVANLAFGFVASRLERRVFVPLVYGFAVLCIGVFLMIFLVRGENRSPLVGQVFYVWLSVFNLFAVTVFWGFMADIFRRDQGKRLFGFIGVGGTAGAICGSAWTTAFAPRLGETGLFACAMVLVGSAGIIAVVLGSLARRRGMTRFSGCGECGYSASGLDVQRCPECGSLGWGERDGEGSRRLGGTGWSGITAVMRSPYLISIAMYVCAFTVLSTLLYFEKMRLIAAFSDDSDTRASLLAWIELGGQSATILLQLFITGRLMRLLGVGTLLAVVPAVTVIGFVGLAVAPSLLVIAMFEASRRASNYALSKPARETLFTVVPRADKYKAKSFIDTFVYRGGDAVGTLADRGIAALGLTVAWVAVPLAAGALLLSYWLGRREELTPEPICEAIPDGSGGASLATAPQVEVISTP
ncbi:MAG: NTP/NDP exchange transporter [Phycisphaerales bacterium JB050]